MPKNPTKEKTLPRKQRISLRGMKRTARVEVLGLKKNDNPEAVTLQ